LFTPMKQWDSMRIELEILMQKQKRLLSSRRGHQQLQAMMHDVELTDERIAYMCNAHEVNMSEAFDDGEGWQAHYGDVRGSIPVERFRLASEEGQRIWDRQFPLRTRTSLLALPQLHPQCVAEDLKAVDDVQDPQEHPEHPKAKPKDLPKRQR
jgi:hypothetical protein